MNTWLSVGLITLSIFVSSIQCDCVKVNITSVVAKTVNPKYVKNEKLSLEVNSNSYTELPLHIKVIRKFPKETVLVAKLSKSKNENGPWQYNQTYVSVVCDLNDRYHNVLPPFLIELTKDGNCIQKGEYNFEDSGQFQFDKLLPAESLKGWFFNGYYQIRTKSIGGIVIKEIEIKSKAY